MSAGLRGGAGGGKSLIHVHAEPIVSVFGEPILWTLRLYDEPDGYERRLPYRAVCTVFVHGRSAEISAMHGIFDRPSWRAIEAWLRAQGVASAAMERRGRLVTLFAADDDRAGASIRPAVVRQ